MILMFSSLSSLFGQAQNCGNSTPSNDFENAHGYIHALRMANDFVVPANQNFTAEKFSFNVIVPIGGAVIETVDYYFFKDSGHGPGEEMFEHLSIAPTSVEVLDTWNIYELLKVTVELPVSHTFSGHANEDTVYWLGLKINANVYFSYWEETSVMTTPNEGYLEYNGNWVSFSEYDNSSPLDGVYEISGSCTPIDGSLNTDDQYSSRLTYYPNPVNDILHISFDEKKKNSVIYNSTGQIVESNLKIANNQADVSHLIPGVYYINIVFENGETDSVKIIKK